MELFLKKYLKGDSIIWAVFIFLCVISLVEMYSASSELAFQHANYTAPILRHLAFLIFGIAIVFVVHLLPLRFIRMGSYVFLLISIILLALVLIMGIETNNAARWIDLGGFKFQPSELAKLSLIVISADFIARIKDSKINEKQYFTILMVVTGVVCALIFTENLSTAIILAFIIWLMMFVGKLHWKKVTSVAVAGVLLAILIYGTGKIVPTIYPDEVPSLLKRFPTWTARIDRAFEKKDEATKYIITDTNRQEQNAKIAIALGGATGKMPGNSVQRDFLPQAYSDYIFAIIIEELGLIGGIVIMLLYLTLLFRAGKIATKSTTVFPAILMIGLSLMIVIQAFVNMAVAIGIGPVTGQPLPMISRGGTSIIVTSLYFGILLSITRHIKAGNTDEDLELDEVLLIDADEDYDEE